MAAMFAFVVLTIYQSSHRPLYAILAWVYFAVMPYHIAYSCTMWKDVLFGACVALLITAVFRIFDKGRPAELDKLFRIVCQRYRDWYLAEQRMAGVGCIGVVFCHLLEKEERQNSGDGIEFDRYFRDHQGTCD